MKNEVNKKKNEFLSKFDIFFEHDANKRLTEEEYERIFLENQKISEEWEDLFSQGEWI